MQLSAGRGYYLTGQRVGGEIVLPLSQVHQMMDRVWTCFLTSVALGSQVWAKIVCIVNGGLAPKVRGFYFSYGVASAFPDHRDDAKENWH